MNKEEFSYMENFEKRSSIRCYDEDLLFTKNIRSKGSKFLLKLLIISILYLYFYFLDNKYISQFFLFQAFFFILVIGTVLFLDQIWYNIYMKKYTFIKKVCLKKSCFNATYISGDTRDISFENVIGIQKPRNGWGKIWYIIDDGKNKKAKTLFLSPKIYYLLIEEIISYFKRTGKTPNFVAADKMARYEFLNFVSYSERNRKKKDKVIKEFWSRHSLDEFT